MSLRRLAKRWTYDLSHVATRLAAVVLLNIRVRGRHHLPREGGVLVCANHQSYLDPVLVGLACDRRLNYLARETLFRFAPFRLLIQWYDAIPIQRDGLGLAGLKETLRRLRRGELVLIFPEGTRTRDGRVAPLKPGFCALARRGHVPLLPVGIDGAFEAWPRGRAWPRLATVQVELGAPLTAAEVAGMDDAQLIDELERRIRFCHARAARGCLT
jgi:1-acyl-sn-glycerol-3-phosphate acyltransferase